MSLNTAYGLPSPCFENIRVGYVGDEWGFVQLSRCVTVIEISPQEVAHLFQHVDLDFLIVTPLAGRSGSNNWMSAGAMKSLDDFPAYGQLISEARRWKVPIVGWMHNEPGGIEENSWLATKCDFVLTPNSRAQSKYESEGIASAVVRNLGHSPLRAIKRDHSVSQSYGIATQSFTVISNRVKFGKDYREFFKSINFDYLDAGDFPRSNPKQFKSESFVDLNSQYGSGTARRYKFVGFRSNSGVASIYDFLDLILQGSYPLGIIDPDASTTLGSPYPGIFRGKRLMTVSIEEVAGEGRGISYEDDYWSYWQDIVLRGLFARELVEALFSLDLAEPEQLHFDRIVILPSAASDQVEFSEEVYLPFLQDGISFVVEDAKQSKLYKWNSADGLVSTRQFLNTDIDNVLSGQRRIKFEHSSPDSLLVRNAVELSRYTRETFDGLLPYWTGSSGTTWEKVQL